MKKMLYRTIKGLSGKLAQMNQQDFNFKKNIRINSESDFTIIDNIEIEATTEKLVSVLTNANNKSIPTITDEMKTVIPFTRLGMGTTEQIYLTCKHCGIILKY